MKETMRERYEKIVERSREKRRHRLMIGVIGSVAAVATAAALAMPAIAAVQGQFDDPAAVTEQTVEQPTEQPDLTTMAVPSEESSAEKNVEQPTSEATEPVTEEPTAEPSAQSEGQPADNGGISTMAEVPGEHVDGGTFMGPENNELTWEVTENDAGERTLTISGIGPMPDYSAGTATPWASYCHSSSNNSIALLRFADGITSVGAYAFSGDNIAEIEFGPTVASIGKQAFSYGNNLLSVTIPGTVKTVGESAFAYHNALQHIAIEQGVETLGTACFSVNTAWHESFIENNGRVVIPASVTGMHGNSFPYATYFEVSSDNPVLTSIDGVVYSKDTTRLIAYPTNYVAPMGEYRIPETVTTIESGAFADTGGTTATTERLYVPKNVQHFPWQTFRGTTFEEVYIENGVPISASNLIFYHCQNLKLVHWPEDVGLNFNGPFGAPTPLQELTFPTSTLSIGTLISGGGDGSGTPFPLETVYYNAQNASITQTYVFPSNQGTFDLVIGGTVDVLPAEFDAIAKYKSEIHFEPSNQITIERGAFASADEPLASLSGTVYVDDQGILYSYDAKAGTATLVNIPNDVTEANIPATLEPEPGVTVAVTGVAQGAAKFADLLKKVTFEAPDKITDIALYAFANCPSLVEVNGKTTVDEVRATFTNPNVTIGTNPFYNTGLEGASGVGGFSQNMHGQQSLKVSGVDVDPMNISLSSEGKTLTWEKATEGEGGGYRLLTGDTLTISANVNNTKMSTDAYYRVYLRLNGEDATLSVSPGDPIEVTDQSTGQVVASGTVFGTSDPYTIYVEFAPTVGSTATVPLTAMYPSPTSSGGGLTVWGVAGAEQTQDDGTHIGDLIEPEPETNVIQAYWDIDPDIFIVTKESGNSSGVGITGNGKGTAILASDLTWTIKLIREDESSSYGKDFARSVDYVDTPALPTGVSWSPDVLQAIKDGNTRASGSNLYAGDTLVATIESTGITGRRITWNETDKTVELHWHYANGDRTKEAAPPNVKVTFKPAAFVVDLEAFQNATDEHVVSNTIETTTHYTYSIDKEGDATATTTLSETKSNLALTKSSTSVAYFGEDIDYTLTVKNTGAGTYTAVRQGSYTVTDELSADIYLKPENIERMFGELPEGMSLTITIKNATLGTWQSVTSTDGSSEAWRTPGNSTLEDATAGHTLTVTAVEQGGYQVVVDGVNTHNADTVEEALREAGYAPTQAAQYTYTLVLNDSNTYFQLDGGATVEATIHATVKTSFELLGTDRPTEYPEETTRSIANTAVLRDADDKQVEGSAGSRQQTVKREAVIGKYVMRDDEVLSEAPVFNEGDVLDYVLDFDHFGSGTYENLPMVDDLYGGQYLLVPVTENPGLAEASLVTMLVDGTDYYILTEGTYTDVKVGYDDRGELLTAATVTVTEATDGTVTLPGEEDNSTTTQTFSGLHTKISWYFSELPGDDYRIEVRYKALVSSEAAGGTGGFSVGNVVWMNDLPDRRIDAGLWGGGSILNFKKQIVEGATEHDPETDVTTDYSLVGPGDTVTYRLDLRNDGTGDYQLVGANLADALPQTFGAFTWDKSDITIETVVEPEDSVTLTGVFEEWGLSTTYDGASPSEGQQYLTWPEDEVIAKFGSNAKLYIYVTLTFPENTEDNAAWDDYAEAAGGAQVQNTLWVCGFASNVTHDLEQRGDALLQKGVYGQYVSTWGNGPNAPATSALPGNERVIYNNADSQSRWVEYYAVVMNTGNARLYLNDLYDRLPEGFTFNTLRATPNGSGSTRSITTKGGDSAQAAFGDTPFVDVSQIADTSTGTATDVRYKSATVTVESNEDGVVRLSFGAGQGDDAVKYDEARQQYYLDRGEAVVFGYLCSIGYYRETADTAPNALAMPYEDYLGTGVAATGSAESDTTVSVKGDDFSTNVNYNDGARYDLDTAVVAERWGIHEEGGVHTRWLASEVTMRRSTATPGVYKRAVSYTMPETTEEIAYEGSAHPNAIINWETTLRNDGPSQIMDYVVTDTMEAPYTFVGEVTFAKTQPDGTTTGASTIFSIASHRAEDDSVVFTRGTTSTSVPVGAEDWTVLPSNYDSTGSVAVKIARTDQGEALSIRLLSSMSTGSGSRWMIPESGGEVTLDYHTENTSGRYASMPYMNDVYLEPDCEFDTTNLGTLVRDESGEAVGVTNAAPVNVAFGTATSSDKSVTETDDPDNAASALGSPNTITLASTASTFTYNLTVRNVSSSALGRMVLIDGLPDEGDASPFDPDAARGSQFKVRFADDPQVNVWLTDAGGKNISLGSEQYRIEFSGKTTFDDADWGGVTATDWNNVSTDARSLRVVLEDEDIVPAGAMVHVSFVAVVDGTADPGDIAWNSFGYRYLVPGSETDTLSAVSMPVGVKVPTVPQLVKSVVDEQGSDVTLDAAATFTFAVYEGEAIDGRFETLDELNEVLGEQSRGPARSVEVTVPAGKSASEAVSLALGDGWTWTNAGRYTVTELGTSEHFSFRDFNNNPTDHYTFTYDPSSQVTLTCHNLSMWWDFQITKIDGDTKDDENPTVLEGAVFALYSPDRRDATTVDEIIKEHPDHAEYAELGIQNVLTSGDVDTGASRTGYLMDIVTIDESGTHTWENLKRDRYYLLEVKAPDGYNLPDEPGQIVYRSSAEGGVLEVEVPNYRGATLPETGGSGTTSYVAAGTTLMAAAYVIHRTRRRRGEGRA